MKLWVRRKKENRRNKQHRQEKALVLAGEGWQVRSTHPGAWPRVALPCPGKCSSVNITVGGSYEKAGKV